MSPEEIVARARRAIGHGCVYKLGSGALIIPGRPEPAMPMDRAGMCDCSGFVCWVLRLQRHERRAEGEKWWGTDNIVADALSKTPWRFRKLAAPEAGALIVYPGHKEERRWSYGHVGVLTGAERVVHCSGGLYRKTGDAIGETDLSVFKANPRTIYAGLRG